MNAEQIAHARGQRPCMPSVYRDLPSPNQARAELDRLARVGYRSLACEPEAADIPGQFQRSLWRRRAGMTLTAGTWTRLGDVIQRVIARIPNKPFSSIPAVPPQAVRENVNAAQHVKGKRYALKHSK
jgi:hypothetical protein